MTQIGLGYVTGQYLANFTTGVLGATLAADAPLAAIRCGLTQTDSVIPGGLNAIGSGKRRIYITELALGVSGVAAFTAAQQFGLYIARFSVANMAGGATALPFKVDATSVDSVAKAGGAEGGEVRVATTAALTTAGVTLDPVKQTLYGWSTIGPAEYGTKVYDLRDMPIELDLGEGLAVFNQVLWPAAGTAVVTGYVRYEERITF